ncbi:hypothetical protein Ancab_036002, partial [Ancistrocladus abbreviatus]
IYWQEHKTCPHKVTPQHPAIAPTQTTDQAKNTNTKLPCTYSKSSQQKQQTQNRQTQELNTPPTTRKITALLHPQTLVPVLNKRTLQQSNGRPIKTENYLCLDIARLGLKLYSSKLRVFRSPRA